MAFTMVDIIILVIIIASALMALLRGLTREVLTIIAWVIAAFGAIVLLNSVRGIFRGMLTSDMIADVVAFVTLFLVILIPALLLANHVVRRFGHTDPGILDRTGGFIFGVARGLFIVGLGYWANAMILERGSVPPWIEDAKLRPIVVGVASIFPDRIGEFNAPAFQDREAPEERRSSVDESKSDESDDGYGRNDRQSLDQLITTTSED